MNNKMVIVITLITLVTLGIIVYFLYTINKEKLVVDTPTTSTPINTQVPATSTVIYNNSEFGFTFTLPKDWTGYSIIRGSWTGNPLNKTVSIEQGTELLIRNPKWEASTPYEDLPVLVFTTAQWSAYLNEDYSIGAAPILASELGRNNSYVFALPARWDFDYGEGYASAQNIIKSNPLKAYNMRSNNP